MINLGCWKDRELSANTIEKILEQLALKLPKTVISLFLQLSHPVSNLGHVLWTFQWLDAITKNCLNF